MGLGPIGSAFGMLMFLTIITNLMMVLAYWSELAKSPARLMVFFSNTGVRTAIAAHIALVVLVYWTAIHGELVLTPFMKVTDIALHAIAPALYVAWWWLLPFKHGLTYSRIPRWMAWPVVYLVFIMLAGSATGAYIYPILDANQLGGGTVALNIAAMLTLLTVLCAALIKLTHWQQPAKP
jgi:hypothetical protein